MAWFTKDHIVGNSVDDFDRKIRELITKHASSDVDVVEGDDDAFKIGDITTNLGNLRRAWAEQDPAERLRWLERTVIAFVSHQPIPETLDVSRLRPGVRSRSTFELASLRYGLGPDSFIDGHEPALEPIAADLAWVLIWDTPATMGTIDKAQIEAWGTPFSELLDTAKLNLAMEPFLGWRVIENKIYSPIGIDDYDGTRVFLPGALDFLPFKDERVVFHPTRTSCLVTSVSDAEGLAIAADLALKELGSANQVSFTPVVGRENSWRPLKLESSHPAYAAWRKLVTVDRLYGYSAQKSLLEQQLGDDLFVAKFSAVESTERGTVSFATWSRNVAMLLPVVDFVAFYEDNAAVVMVPWDAVVELVGHLLEPTNHYPHRFRVVDFPADGELEVLRTLAADL
jgi:hypothetical protein